ncbi:FecR family protein [Snuella sedimenti]|uniref:FecR family protein n=1 Tax=Snuella sedimenti TaxID=2798802 RepID=A0A8J7IZG3_9FLAO|nr:FecR domain-containing protein [Snuella sedimenti]MBJ6366682.1 FecR family protein [Snuella sedimenti]
MIPQEIENLIVKYINKSANAKDLDKLIEWIKTDNNKAQFKEFAKDHYAITFSMQDPDAKHLKEFLFKEIRKDKSRTYKKKLRSIFKYAAVAIIFLSIGYFYQKGILVDSSNSIPDPENKITLQLEDGTLKTIDENESAQIFSTNGSMVGIQKGKQLAYVNDSKIEKLTYNTLTVPYGRRFNVILSDGTHIYLNAGSSLKYPVRFIKGSNRQVFLNGEAYFNVTKDSKQPFIVNSNELNIRVLGTQFNVSSYPEDGNINTVLVEGSVSLYNKNETYSPSTSSLLEPRYMAAWNKNNKQLHITKTDIAQHIAWIEGRLILNEVRFNDILKKLERQYDVTFVNNHKALEDRYFTARFDIEDIFQVMKSLSEAASFTYKIEEKEIIINP